VTDSSNINSRGEDDSSITRSSLLIGLKSGDDEAWRRLSVLYGPVVYQWCLKYGVYREDAEDVVQEVFRTVSEKISAFRHDRDGDTFRGWLWTITRHKLGDCIRRAKRAEHGVGGTEALHRLDSVPLPEDDSNVPSSDMRMLYRRVLALIQAEFEERTWTAALRVIVEEVSPRDVATEMEMSVNSVYLAKSRVLRRVREELGEVEDSNLESSDE
jgi:RNA polymerase sigma-70 factor (ECF subfamily)